MCTEESWDTPPPEPFDVSVRFNLNKLTDVDTVRSKAWVSVGVMFYWTDPRLVGWQGSLPTSLWGPSCWFFNALTDLVEVPQDFQLADAASGRMMRYVRFMGTIDFKQMLLNDFPLDVNEINLTFRTASHWTSLDGRSGSKAKGKAYSLVPVSAPGEGKLFRLLWGGDLQELSLLGVSLSIVDNPPSASWQEVTTMTLRFHVARNVEFYFWKVLLPVYLFMIFTLCVFALGVKDYSDRLSDVLTLFMASFAMLYVVQQHLPKTNFLTCIDKIVVITSVILAGTGITFVVLEQVSSWHGIDVARAWNMRLCLGTFVFYLVANLFIFAPTYKRKLAKVKEIVALGLNDGKPESTQGLLASGENPRTVPKQFDIFVPLESMPRS